MDTFKIIPALGLKLDVSPDDYSMLNLVSQNIGITRDAGGQNVEYNSYRNACSKCQGYGNWNNSAVGSSGIVNALFEIDDGTNIDNLIFDHGKVYYYNGSKDPVEIKRYHLTVSNVSGNVEYGETVTGATTATQATVVRGLGAGDTTVVVSNVTGGTGNFSAAESLTFSGASTADCDSTLTEKTFNNNAVQPHCVIQYGSYAIFSDWGAASPHKWANGAANILPLVTKRGATLYKFRYIIEWYNHIIGAYSDQTNGDIEIRWTDILPSWTALEFPSANQLYKPGTDSITGISKMGVDTLLLYGRNSISKIQYYPSASTLFGAVVLVQDHGCTNHHSIINAYGSNWFFNKEYGFVRYSGGSSIDEVISHDIESLVEDIPTNKYSAIIGKHISQTQELVWLIPSSSDTPDSMLYYSVRNNTWRKETKTAHMIDTWTQASGARRKFVSADNGDVYKHSVANFDGAYYQAYRHEPALHFGDPKKKKLIEEIWMGIRVMSSTDGINIFHRAGDTIKECVGSSFQYIGTISSTDLPVLYIGNTVLSVSYDNMAGGENAKFSVGETITGQVGGTTAVITGIVRTSSTTGTVYFKGLSGGDGGFDNNEQLSNGNGQTADCSGTNQSTAIDTNARFHQIKWGTDSMSDGYTVNFIEFIYVVQDNY